MQLNLEDKRMGTNYRIKLPNDSMIECAISNKLVPITIDGTTSLVDLIQFDLSDFNIILGMNWSHTYGAKIDCDDLKVILKDEKRSEVLFYGQREEESCSLISVMKASKLLCRGYIGFWCYAINTQLKEEKAGNIPIVCEFEDIFLEELPGLHPQRKIDFEIE